MAWAKAGGGILLASCGRPIGGQNRLRSNLAGKSHAYFGDRSGHIQVTAGKESHLKPPRVFLAPCVPQLYVGISL